MINWTKYLIIKDLHITRLEEKFAGSEELTTKDLLAFFKELNENVPKSTVNWRVYELVRNGILERVGKGRFILGSESKFHPSISIQIKQLNYKIKKQFPFISYCLWDNGMIKPFHQHLPSFRFILVDAEKEVMESLFVFFKEEYKNTYLKPDKEMMDKYIIQDKDSIVVRQLISESPTQVIDEVATVTIEKMLVDIFADHEFEYLKGSELLVIFKNAFDHFTINKSKLLRYASRKGQQEKLLKLLEENNLIKSRSI